MDTILYLTLGAACAFTVFYFGWVFGCAFVERDRITRNRDCYTDDFHNDYYAGSCCKKNDQHHNKPKAKKAKKKA